MTPQDVAYSLNTVANPKSAGSYTLRVGLWLDRAEAAGPATVRLRMKAPYAMALWDLCYYVKIRKDKVYDDPAKPGEFVPTAQATSINGTGPYRVVEFRTGPAHHPRAVQGIPARPAPRHARRSTRW